MKSRFRCASWLLQIPRGLPLSFRLVVLSWLRSFSVLVLSMLPTVSTPVYPLG